MSPKKKSPQGETKRSYYVVSPRKSPHNVELNAPPMLWVLSLYSVKHGGLRGMPVMQLSVGESNWGMNICGENIVFQLSPLRKTQILGNFSSNVDFLDFYSHNSQ